MHHHDHGDGGASVVVVVAILVGLLLMLYVAVGVFERAITAVGQPSVTQPVVPPRIDVEVHPSP